MDLIPYPKELKEKDGKFRIYESCLIVAGASLSENIVEAVSVLSGDIKKYCAVTPAICGKDSSGKNTITFTIDKSLQKEGYSLNIADNKIEIIGGSEAGIFYGIQTLRQIISSCGAVVPCLSIQDYPDFESRGFYHDITRGKVPKLETLLQLVDKMAFYKLNQLQLYIEHTFEFDNHTDIWAGSDPITPEEILILDRYCRKNYIDLVPSLNTFGHLYVVLRSKRKEHLNELDVKASERPFSFRDRMRHYTLDSSSEDALAFVEDIIDRYSSLFTSKYFNICCDETYDLGKGKNISKAEKDGVARLYIEFLGKITDIVKAKGMVPMFWADIIRKTPELIGELPEGAIALNWIYGPRPNEEASTC